MNARFAPALAPGRDGTSGPSQTRQTLTLAECADLYMIGYSGRNNSVISHLDWWIGQLGARALQSITDEDIACALEVLKREPATYYAGGAKRGGSRRVKGARSGSTINRYAATLGGLIKFARRKRIVPRTWVSPLEHIEREPESPGKLRYLSKDEYRRLLTACKAAQWPKLYALVKLAVESGCRRGALLSLRWRDIDWDSSRALVERTKNGTPHTIVILPDTLAALRKVKAAAKGAAADDLVFCGRRPGKPCELTKGLKAALELAKISGVTFHSLRHTHASWLASRGASLVQIAESLNHRTLAMVKRYAHLCVDDRAKLLAQVFVEDKEAA